MIDNGNDAAAIQVESEMDRRSWLWRRKSSEKSAAETATSSSSSHPDRFSDDQVYAVRNPQPPDVSSKVVVAEVRGEETNDDVRSSGNELSAAHLNISAKEDLIKQHAKVAEEAVSGWEKAEDELIAVKQQLEAATKKNLGLEVRVVHLDTALQECVRQLRQAREEQEQKINEIVARKTHEWESIKSELKKKLEAAENENSSLKHELLSQAEEIEIRIMERDLSTVAAETASKQHLESIKKVAKLETECRRLKTVSRKASPAMDHKSSAASSCCSNSRTSAGLTKFSESKNHNIGRNNVMVPALNIDFMDDFLEMERLAALPVEAGSLSKQTNGVENPARNEHEALIHRTAELEERIKNLEEEKVENRKLLSESQSKLEISLVQRKEADGKMVELQAQLAHTNEAKKVLEEEREIISLSAENSVRSRKLEEELSEMKHQAEKKRGESLNEQLKINQEKELAEAASKFAECQKTISSLSEQLKSLATMDNLLLDLDKFVVQ